MYWMPAVLAAARWTSTSAPGSVARRRLMMELYPIFLMVGIASTVIAPAHATVDSTRAKFRMPGTSSLTSCAVAADAPSQAIAATSAALVLMLVMDRPPFG